MTSNWDFILTLLSQGKTVEEIADVCKTTYKNMWNRIRRHEVKDNCIYMNEKQLRPRKNNNGVRGKSLAVCPVTKKARVPEDCAECFEKDCKGKIQDDPEEEKVVFSRCSGCCHNLTDHCGLCVSAYGSEKGCNLFEVETDESNDPAEKPALHCQTAETAEAIDWSELEDIPDQCKNCHSYQVSFRHPGCANFETCEIVKGGPFKTVQQIGDFKVAIPRDELDRIYEKSKEEVKLKTFAFNTEKLTVTRSVYAEIERQIDHCEEMIAMAKRTWEKMEKERRSWEAILTKLLPERSPEEDGEEFNEKPGGES